MTRWRPFRRWSLTARLVASYLVILSVGGLLTLVVGSYMVSSTMMGQERRTARHDLAAARSIYERQLEALQHAVRFAAESEPLLLRIQPGRSVGLVPYLRTIRDNGPFDFVGITDSAGVLLAGTRVTPVDTQAPFRLDSVPLVRRVGRTGAIASTEVVPFDLLRYHDPALELRARLRTDSLPPERRNNAQTLTGGLVQMAVAPVRDANGRLVAVLYAGNVLAASPDIVDRVNRLVYRGERYHDRLIGSVTIFQQNVRIATTVRDSGSRAFGTKASPPVADLVLKQGGTWNDRAYVVNDWYVSAYEPIRNSDNAIVGMLHVGILQKVFTQVRDRVILSFLVIAGLGFLAIIITTWWMIRRLTRPLVRMAEITRQITAGQFGQTVRTDLPGEIGLLAESFNTMQASLQQMHGDLEEWGRTLEEKVVQRTEELGRMQARVAQSEHLASIGMLAAGVAHEINNPLGGILALTSLTLEDTKEQDPRRENLEEVVRQTERCRNIVKGLLEFSRQSETHQQEPVDINQVLAKTLNLVEKQALFFNVEVVRNWQDDLPPVIGDRSELQQVFMNLIVNAVQSMERGVVRLETSFDPVSSQVQVRVADTGRGIPRELIDRIFDPFFTTKDSGQGTGLGLSIAYGIITKHGGTIGVESELGRGTCFTVRFPVHAEVPA